MNPIATKTPEGCKPMILFGSFDQALESALGLFQAGDVATLALREQYGEPETIAEVKAHELGHGSVRVFEASDSTGTYRLYAADNEVAGALVKMGQGLVDESVTSAIVTGYPLGHDPSGNRAVMAFITETH